MIHNSQMSHRYSTIYPTSGRDNEWLLLREGYRGSDDCFALDIFAGMVGVRFCPLYLMVKHFYLM